MTNTQTSDSKSTDFEKVMGTMFSSIMDDYKKEVAKRLSMKLEEPEIVEAISALAALDYQKFGSCYLRPHDEIATALVGHALSENYNLQFIIVQQDFVGHHFQTLFQTVEGHASCADKQRTVMRALIRFFHTGKRIEFDYNAEYTYSLPKHVLTTHESILEYFESLRSLFYGKPDRYIQQINAFNKIAAEIHRK